MPATAASSKSCTWLSLQHDSFLLLYSCAQQTSLQSATSTKKQQSQSPPINSPRTLDFALFSRLSPLLYPPLYCLFFLLKTLANMKKTRKSRNLWQTPTLPPENPSVGIQKHWQTWRKPPETLEEPNFIQKTLEGWRRGCGKKTENVTGSSIIIKTVFPPRLWQAKKYRRGPIDSGSEFSTFSGARNGPYKDIRLGATLRNDSSLITTVHDRAVLGG